MNKFLLVSCISVVLAETTWNVPPNATQMYPNTSDPTGSAYQQTCETVKEVYQGTGCCSTEEPENTVNVVGRSLVPGPGFTEDHSDCMSPVYIYCDVHTGWNGTSYTGQWEYYGNASAPGINELIPFQYIDDTVSGDIWIDFTTIINSYAVYHAMGTHGNVGGSAAYIDQRRGWVSEIYPNSYAAFNGWVGIKLNFGFTYTMAGWGNNVPMISAMGICDEVMNYGDEYTNPFKAYGFAQGTVLAGASTL